MIKKNLHILTIFLCLVSKIGQGQQWERTFSTFNHGNVVCQIFEDYDRGYIIQGDILYGNIGKVGFLIKTDINGNLLFEKKLGNGSIEWDIQGGDKTFDGGVILCGITDSLDIEKDPYIVKLDACREIEWCRVFHTDNDVDYSEKIKSLEDGSFIYLLYNWGSNGYDHSVWLMHLDNLGGIIWEQEYFTNDTLIQGELPRWLEVLPDNRYLITGYCYYPDSGQVSPEWVRPMLILADSAGEAQWEIPWGYTNPFGEPVTGEGFQSVQNLNSIYSCISNYHGPDPNYSPTLIKTSISGIPSYFKDLIDSTIYGKASTITKLSDATFAIGTGYRLFNSLDYLSVFKTDTNGNVLKEKVLNNSDFIPIDATKTIDDKILITALDWINNKYVIKLWKLNSNLEYDSIYTRPFTYDSLCPHAIVSDTLFPQCDVITGMQGPVKNTEKVKMKVYPNPAHETVHVQMPQCIQRETSTAHLTITTVFHQWNKDLQFAVFDNFGRLVLQRAVKPDEKEVVLDVASWAHGIYLLRLVYLDTVVGREKLVVE